MSFGPYREHSAERLSSLIQQSRIDLGSADLNWIVTQQRPTEDKAVNHIDAVDTFKELAASDPHLNHISVFDLDGCEKKLVISTLGVVQLGERMANAYLNRINE